MILVIKEIAQFIECLWFQLVFLLLDKMARNTESSTYPPSIGLVYVFNLIVGTGALTLPAAFANAGWIVSLSVILALSAISYITLTFVVESMAAANAILRSKRAKQLIKKESLEHSSYPQDDSDSDESESPAKSLLERVKVRKTRSLCSSPNLYSSVIQSEDYDHPTTSSVINENSDFVLLIGAFGFFNVQKTLLLQILTGLVRWTAFIAMIILACVRLLSSPKENQGHPPVANVNGLPNLFGACVYSFMCHHSLPSLVTPISPKRGLYKLLALDYFMIAGFYLLLGFTGMFAFPHLEDLYTLNFVPNRSQQALFYFLTLFPVFTLSTSFPIITITLRNNLKQLFLRRNEADYNFFVRRLLFPLLALIPPTVLAIITSDISFLVGITGSYAGAAVQYIIPALLVFYARKAIKKEFLLEPVRNAFASPFRHTCFVLFVLLWSCASIGFVTYNHLMADK
ncbi:hypothetical protein DAPPUDRAFT_322812 [Daphnia pulex]|uniref:Amino acid transporter transmembrane domain-containing protein n=1 Tax=Daphnia pulex TaxID=6669 RepID=E9GX14_DAPPU|nr:hypothetical protein DAPPUDRAFT_322812 [Daphnia pulex]|eukprot:EFX75992.1 hypothetical protein DAPPUDRAFT_322812 [Daphnia pulex]